MSAQTPVQRYAWNLSQERIDCLAFALNKLETILNIAAPGGIVAERIGGLLTDLRMECCQRGGAADPFPDMPVFPSFEESLARRRPGDSEESVG